jgi:AraC-like DNA-binding protein
MSVRDPRTLRAIALLRESFCSPSFKDIAETLNLSPSRLRHLIKADVGLSPEQYVKHLRMEKAKELLQSTFLSVKQIMFTVGYADPSHFSRDFKGIYGTSPCNYRVRNLRPANSGTPDSATKGAAFNTLLP